MLYKKLYLYWNTDSDTNADANADADAKMLMPRFPNSLD